MLITKISYGYTCRGYNLLISQRSILINASVYNEHIYTMASAGSVTYQSFLFTVAYIYTEHSFHFMAFFSGDFWIST